MKFATALFKFFASLHLAIFLLVALALVFAAGTFIESMYGTEAAGLLVYRTSWMALLLVLLALNVAAAALDRLPWKKKHTGFVITHVGIILILAGSLVTRAYGVEGQMAITEGDTANRIILSQPLLQIFSADSDAMGFFNLPARAFSWKGRETLRAEGMNPAELPQVRLLDYFARASRKEEVEESKDGPPALYVVLESSFMKSAHWLVLDDPEQGRLSLGPADLSFTREPLRAQKEISEWGELEFQFENKTTTRIPLKQITPMIFPLKGTPYQVTVLRVLKDARVEGGKLIDQSENWNNPATELLMEGEGLQEKHTIFSQFPDFPTVHGIAPSRTGVRILYHRSPQAGSSKNELRFVTRESGLPFYQVRKKDEISQGELKLGEKYPTGWMDFQFRAEKYFPHARNGAYFSEEPIQSQNEEHLSAIQVEMEWKGEKKSFWFGQGDKEVFQLGGRSFHMVYGLRMLPVGFRLKLREFRIEHYPGTSRPASFESDVTLMDDSTGLNKEINIRMNEPLKYRGFKVFQSGYQQPEGEPEVSIFTVAKDPGIPIKYAGALVLIAGIVTMFYSKRFSSRPGEKKLKKKEEVLSR